MTLSSSGTALAGSDPAITAARCRHLATTANPSQRHDYVVSFSGELHLPSSAQSVAVVLRYVPDRLILRPAAFPIYLGALSAGPWDTLESLATTILTDVDNELVPRWVHLRLTTASDDGSERHNVDAESRQPNWDNPSLLARAGPL